MNGSVPNGFRKIPNHAVIKRLKHFRRFMRGKALTLALLLFASALAGCIGQDREINPQEDCEHRGGEWVEDPDSNNSEPLFKEYHCIFHDLVSTDSGSDIALDNGAQPEVIDSDQDGLSDRMEITQYGTDFDNDDTDGDGLLDGWEVANGLDPLDGGDAGEFEECSERGGNWTAAPDREDEYYCDFGEEEDRDDEREITQEDCEERGGNWTAAPDREDEYYCDFDEEEHEDRQEITQEDCEQRGYNWTEVPDREGEYYCDFEVEENREITQEDCERRGGNWTAAPDREGEHYCHFDEEEREDEANNGTSDDRTDNNTADDNTDDSSGNEDTQEDCEARGGTWIEDRRMCQEE
jgi:hypothetical protein